jgi:Glycolipid 2-alpha-mannosyltransferase
MLRRALQAVLPYIALALVLSVFLTSIWPEDPRLQARRARSALYPVMCHPDLRRVGCRNATVEAAKPRENAVLVVLTRGHSELDKISQTVHTFESSFNRVFRYPYLFMAAPDEPFEEDFRDRVRDMLPDNAELQFGEIESDDWTLPPWLTEAEVRAREEEMASQGVMYVCTPVRGHLPAVIDCALFQGTVAEGGIITCVSHPLHCTASQSSADKTQQQADGIPDPLPCTPCSDSTTGIGGSSRDVRPSLLTSLFFCSVCC